MSETSFYYFIDGYDKVFVLKEYLCDDENGAHPQYHALSNQQLEWYLAHPGASAHEVKNLCTDQELFEKGNPLPGYKSRLCGRLSLVATSRMEQLIPRDKLDDALLDWINLQTGGETELMGTEAAQEVNDRIRYYKDVRQAIKQELARVRLLIASAGTHAEADAAYASCHINEIRTGKEAWDE